MRRIIIFFIIIYLMVSCGICENDDTVKIIRTSIIKEETITKTLNNTQGKTLYLVKMNPTSKVISAAAGGYVYSNDISRTSDDEIFISENESELKTIRKDNPIALTFYSKSSSSRSVRMFDEYEYELNDEKKFWVMENEALLVQNIKWEEKTAKLRVKSDFCYIWVPDEYWENGDNSVTEKIANNLGEKFDAIYPRVTNVFGYPSSNEELRIHILIFDLYSDSENGQVFGYFMPKDYGSYDEIYRSNECCMFYLDAYLTKDKLEMAYSTLAHEFQHMINHYNKTLNVVNPEITKTWFTEMLSMLCEDMLQTFLETEESDSPISRMKYFNSYYYDNGITEWQGTQTSYACVYAFGAYLIRNFGGIKLLSAIAKNSATNTEAITKALKELGYDETFDSVFLKFSQALIYEDSNKLTFNKEITETFGEYEYTFKAFNIWEKENNTYTKYGFIKIQNYGPVCFSPSVTKTIRPYGFTIHTQDSWKNISTDTLTVNIVKQEGCNVSYQFILK